MDDEKLSDERAVRLLRAKAAELEADVKNMTPGQKPANTDHIAYLTADIALIADLLADHIERAERRPFEQQQAEF